MVVIKLCTLEPFCSMTLPKWVWHFVVRCGCSGRKQGWAAKFTLHTHILYATTKLTRNNRCSTCHSTATDDLLVLGCTSHDYANHRPVRWCTGSSLSNRPIWSTRAPKKMRAASKRSHNRNHSDEITIPRSFFIRIDHTFNWLRMFLLFLRLRNGLINADPRGHPGSSRHIPTRPNHRPACSWGVVE